MIGADGACSARGGCGVEIENGDLGAVLGEQLRRCQPEPTLGSRTRHDTNLARQQHGRFLVRPAAVLSRRACAC